MRTVRHGLRTQVVATLGLAPLTLVFFQQLSVVGFVANLVAIPLVTLLITPLALLGVLAPPLWQAGAGLVHALAEGLGWLAAMPGAVWTAGAAPAWAQGAGLLGAVLLLSPLPWRLRALALPLMLALFVPPHVAAGRGSDGGHAGRRRSGQRGTGAHPQSPAAARCRAAILAGQRGRHARLATAAAQPGHAARRLADAQPPRCRSRRRRCCAAGRHAGDGAVVVARSLAPVARQWPATYPLRGRPAMAVGWRAILGTASAGRGLPARGGETQRHELCAAHHRRRRPQPAADRRHRGRAGAALVAGRCRGTAQQCAGGATPRQPDVIDGRVPRRRAAAAWH